MTYYVVKSEETYAPLFEAYGLARVISRLAGNKGVFVEDAGWGYKVIPPADFDAVEALKKTGRMGPVRAAQREGSLRFLVKKGDDEGSFPPGMALNEEEIQSMWKLARLSGEAPVPSVLRLQAADRRHLQSDGFQKDVLSIINLPVEEFAAGINTLLRLYGQEDTNNVSKTKPKKDGKHSKKNKQESPDNWVNEESEYFQLLHANKLQGVGGGKTKSTKVLTKKELIKNQTYKKYKLWLTALGYYQSSVVGFSGKKDREVDIMVPLPRRVNILSVAAITDSVAREIYGLNSSSVSSAKALTRMIQLFLEKEEVLESVLETCFFNASPNNIAYRPFRFNQYNLPLWLKKLDKRRLVKLYFILNEAIEPLTTLTRMKSKDDLKWAVPLAEELAVKYLRWISGGSLLDLGFYVASVNFACQQHFDKLGYSFLSGNLLQGVVENMTMVTELLRKSLTGQDSRFDTLTRVIRNLTTGAMIDKKDKNKNKPIDIRYDLTLKLLNSCKNPHEFRQILQDAVARYNDLAARYYDPEKKDKEYQWYPVDPSSLSWLYQFEPGDFEEAATLLVAHGTGIPHSQKNKTDKGDMQ